MATVVLEAAAAASSGTSSAPAAAPQPGTTMGVITGVGAGAQHPTTVAAVQPYLSQPKVVPKFGVETTSEENEKKLEEVKILKKNLFNAPI